MKTLIFSLSSLCLQALRVSGLLLSLTTWLWGSDAEQPQQASVLVLQPLSLNLWRNSCRAEINQHSRVSVLGECERSRVNRKREKENRFCFCRFGGAPSPSQGCWSQGKWGDATWSQTELSGMGTTRCCCPCGLRTCGCSHISICLHWFDQGLIKPPWLPLLFTVYMPQTGEEKTHILIGTQFCMICWAGS